MNDDDCLECGGECRCDWLDHPALDGGPGPGWIAPVACFLLSFVILGCVALLLIYLGGPLAPGTNPRTHP